MAAAGEARFGSEEQLGDQAALAWEAYRESHNPTPNDALGGYLVWGRQGGGWLRVRRAVIQGSDGGLASHPTRLAMQLRGPNGARDADFSAAPGEPIEPILWRRPLEPQAEAEILSMLETEPMMPQEATDAFREMTKAAVEAVIARGRIIVAPDLT